MSTQPEQLDQYDAEYKPQAWEAYTLAELGWWVHLFAKRAGHRSDAEKRAKDLNDADNYLAMMKAKVDALRLTAAHCRAPVPVSATGEAGAEAPGEATYGGGTR